MKYDVAPSEGNKAKWDQWGTRSYTVMPHVSPLSKRIAEAYRLRQSDVVVLSFPKTGTTWTQTVCEQLRTNAEGYDGFDDIAERQPWLEFAYDCGQDLNDETYGKSILLREEEEPKLAAVDTKGKGSDESQPPSSPLSTRGPLLTPRIFKSHQLLSAINPGGKYLCIVRDPAATLLSWFDFQKAKGRPGYAEYANVNEYIANRSELFSGNHIFGRNLWEMYAEVWSARNDPSVKILVYEGLIADALNGYMDHLPIIDDFLGLKRKNHVATEAEEEGNAATKIETKATTKEFYEKVAGLVSRAEMVKHVDKFDDHFIADRGKAFGRALRIMEPAPKVRLKSAGNRTELSEATLEWLEDQWFEKMTPKTGHTTYDEFATDLSELLFADDEAFAGVQENENDDRGKMEETWVLEERNEAKARTSSRIMARRQSSLVVQHMPGIRRRRESLVPHE